MNSKDSIEAFNKLKDRAWIGDSDAQFSLGHHFRRGICVPKNLVESTTWFREAAEQGHAEAQIITAYCYMMGEGVAYDLAQAVHWWRKAAEQGHPQALGRMGVCFERGEGVKRDPIEAYAYYKLASMKIELHPLTFANLEDTMSSDEIAVGKMRTKELLKEINAKIAARRAGK